MVKKKKRLFTFERTMGFLMISLVVMVIGLLLRPLTYPQFPIGAKVTNGICTGYIINSTHEQYLLADVECTEFRVNTLWVNKNELHLAK